MFPDFDAKAREIRGRFIAKASGQEPRLRALVSQLGVSCTTETLEELQFIVHQLAGSAGTFGFPEIGTAAEAVEVELRAQGTKAGTATAALTEKCNRLLALIDQAFREAAPVASPTGTGS